jgi:UDP-2,4-diacetamido-2,4,6-trideoxy-beta-L-altropyranose hydrolase
VIRTDVSAQIGTGHLRRSLALGQRLSDQGIAVHFLVMGDCPAWALETGRFAEAIAFVDRDEDEDARGTVQHCRQAGADRLVVDRYRTPEAYQRVLLDAELRWMQFDGAASDPMWADWVVSMSPAAGEPTYRALQRREQTRLLLGPEYAILREEFLEARAPRRARPVARELLLSFGGGDDRGACLACLEALRGMVDFRVSILASSYNPGIEAIQSRLRAHADPDAALLVDTPDVARRMAHADIAITAAGTTTFETAAMGLPSLVIQIAENQRGNAEAWARLGVAVNLGPLAQLDARRLRRELQALAGDPVRRQEMADRGQAQVDGQGVERLARELHA